MDEHMDAAQISPAQSVSDGGIDCVTLIKSVTKRKSQLAHSAFPSVNKKPCQSCPQQLAPLHLDFSPSSLSSITSANPVACASPLDSPPSVPHQFMAWLYTFLEWQHHDRLLALRYLADACDPEAIRYLRALIEPHFRRDFVKCLPKELALKILSQLGATDLLRASQTSQAWRNLAEDCFLWREKCEEAGIIEHGDPRDNRTTRWKAIYLRHSLIEANWRRKPLKEQSIMKGHDDHVVTCLQLSGDDRIISGSDDNTLRIWDANTGECLFVLTGHMGGVWCSQVTDDGTMVVSGSTDRTVRVWSISDGSCLHVLQGHSSTVRCLALKGHTVVSGSRDTTLRVWDVVTGQLLHVLNGHLSAVRCVLFDGEKVVSGAYDYTVKVWDVATETLLFTLSGHVNRIYSLQWNPAQGVVVSGSLDTTIRVWDMNTGQCMHTLLGHKSLNSDMQLRGHILVSGNADATVRVWNIRTGQCLHIFAGANKHESAVTCLECLESSSLVVSSSDDGTVKLWDSATGAFVRDLVRIRSGGQGGVVWRLKASRTRLVCAVGSRNGVEETKLMVQDFHDLPT